MIDQEAGNLIFLHTLEAVWEEWYEDDLSFYGAVRIVTEMADVLTRHGWQPLQFHELDDRKVTGTKRQIAERALIQAVSTTKGNT